ncbi:helix-turn-helix domain-containing protein [Deinococcus hopiensis]|uniref:Helix-turn-helix n=1 Tax=Deinococcus hopiensis KR-140 TaxID=695939 RepID=A0A1W1VIP9_9DEIO|nr:helix-turn-helix transcriptional regulator [Deinococcus hopiensis]SMB93198.1 Helix-turn-helix [Deinococcus hopiensis KR-140]
MNDRIRLQAREAMKKQGLTQEQLGERAGIPRTHVSQMLSGAIGKMPDRWTALADALGMEIVLQPKLDAPIPLAEELERR